MFILPLMRNLVPLARQPIQMRLTINVLTFCSDTSGGPPTQHEGLEVTLVYTELRHGKTSFCAWKICLQNALNTLPNKLAVLFGAIFSDCPSKKQNIPIFVGNLFKAQLKRPKRLQRWIKHFYCFCWLPSSQ